MNARAALPQMQMPVVKARKHLLFPLRSAADPRIGDSTAISTALWSFAGYFPYFLLGNLSPFFDKDPTNLYTLIGQGGAVGMLAAYGLFRDIRRETCAEKTVSNSKKTS